MTGGRMSEPTKCPHMEPMCCGYANRDGSCCGNPVPTQCYGCDDCQPPATPLPAPDHGAARDWARRQTELNGAFAQTGFAGWMNLARAYLALSGAGEAGRVTPHAYREHIQREGYDLLICFNNHAKGEPCEYVRFSPAAPHGEAVAWGVIGRDAGFMGAFASKQSAEMYRDEVAPHWADGDSWAIAPLFTHPAPAARVTSEMVERAAKALATEDGNAEWAKLAKRTQENYRATLRRILTAALSEATNA